MKNTPSKKELKNKKEPKSKEIIKEEFEDKKEEKTKDIIPDIDSDIEEEKSFIQENSSDFIPDDISGDNFQEEFPSLVEKRKVSLDRMGLQKQGNFNLEDFIENSPINQIQKQAWQEEFNPLSYTAGIKSSDEPKYIDYDGSFGSIDKVKVNSLSTFHEQKASFQFNPMHKQEEKSIETYVPAEKMNMSELRKKKDNIVDSLKEVKYTPGKY